MPEDGSPRSRPIRRTLIALARAAGLLILIAGLDGALSVAMPRLQPLSRNLVSLLAGVLVFELLRPTRRRARVPAPALSLQGDDSAAELAEAVRIIDGLRAETERLRAESMEREAALRRDEKDLLDINNALRRQIAEQQEEAAGKAGVAEAAIAELRRELAAAREQYEAESEHLQKAAGRAFDEIQQTSAAAGELRAEVERERSRAEEASRELEAVRSSSAAFAGERQKLQSQLAGSREELQRERRRSEQAVRELQNALSSAAAVATQQQKLESQLADFDQRLASAMQELDALRAERQRVRREIEETRQRSEVEKSELRRSMEAEWSAKLQKVTAGLSAAREAVLAEADAAREALQRQIGNERNHFSAVLEEQKAALTSEIESRWTVKLQEMTDNLAADRQNAIGEMIADREAMRVQLRSATGRAEELERELEHERESRREFAAKEAALEEENTALRRGTVDASALRASIAAEWEAKLRTIVAELTANHRNEIGDATAARETAVAEARALREEIEQVRRERLRLLQGEENNRRELEGEREKRTGLEEQLATLREQLAHAVDEKALRQSIEAEWSTKLQKIVTGLVTDHEHEIGESIAAREAARAESRSLTLRVQELQQRLDKVRQSGTGEPRKDDEVARELDAERQTRVRLEDEIEALKGQLAQTATADGKTLRESIDAEWSQKLQTIISHISSDHEAGVGKAIEEREAARAETRSLVVKVTALQQKIESDRQSFLAAQEKWNSIHDSLQARLREAGQEPAATPSSPPLTPEPGDEERRARADVLEFAEQASAVLQRTSPGTVPLPSLERAARLLFVHHDPAMRTMWRDKLGQSGFDVQTAVDGLEGLRLTVAGKPDVVIADASMPKMGGRELCQLIKSNQETSGVKVILMIGVYTNEVPIDAASREFEADELLQKPVKFEALKAALSNLLAVS